MRLKTKITTGFLIVSLCGCAWLRNGPELLTLQKVSKSGEEITRHLTEQEKLFYALRDDLIHDRLEPGLSKENIITAYGEPVLSKGPQPNQPSTEILLYRHPTKFFSSDRIYLHFDESNILTHWEHKL